MKINPDTLTTVFGLTASVGQLLGQFGIVDQATSTTISAIALALLGVFSNKQPKPIL